MKMCMDQLAAAQSTDESIIERILNTLLRDALPTINSVLDNEIKANGYDPMPNVTHGGGSAGHHRILFCTFGADYSYSVSNLTGLSSLKIASFTLSDFRATGSATGICNCNLNLNVGEMTAQLSGHGSVDACGIHVGAGLSGSVKVASSTAAPSATLSAGYSLDPLSGQINSLILNSVNLNLGHIAVHIDSLPWPLDDLLDAIASAITNEFRGQLDGVLNSVIQTTLNKALSGIMPIKT